MVREGDGNKCSKSREVEGDKKLESRDAEGDKFIDRARETWNNFCSPGVKAYFPSPLPLVPRAFPTSRASRAASPTRALLARRLFAAVETRWGENFMSRSRSLSQWRNFWPLTLIIPTYCPILRTMSTSRYFFFVSYNFKIPVRVLMFSSIRKSAYLIYSEHLSWIPCVVRWVVFIFVMN